MDKLVMTDWILMITALGTIIALISNVVSMRDRGKKEAEKSVEMWSDIKHIREKVDRMDNIPERVTAVEESAKSAHKRIDRIEGSQTR